MIQVMLAEPTVNQMKAALDAREKEMTARLAVLKSQHVTESRDAAIEIVEHALFWTVAARMELTDAEPFRDHPAQMTWTEAA